MSKLKDLNKPQPYMSSNYQLVFSNKFNPLEVYHMLFNDETLRALFESSWVLCRIGEYPMSRYDYDRFITKFSRPCVFMDTIIEMDNSYQGNITVPTQYEPVFRSLKDPVIHPVVISNAESITGFRIAYFVVYDRSELIATNIYSGKWWDYGMEDKNET